MNTRSISVIVALALASGCRGTVERPAPCEMPTETRLWQPYIEERLDVSSIRYHPAWPPAITEEIDIRELAGHYRLTMIRTSGIGADSLVRGTLELVSTTAAHVDIARQLPGMPLIGWAAIDVQPLGYLPLAHPLDRRDPGRPGIQSMYNPETRSLRFVAGNNFDFRYGDSVSYTTHVGIRMYVFRGNAERIVGRWTGGGRIEPGVQGYFCAERVS